ncbi:penicillin-binding protein 1A [Luteimonas sp. MC1572]|uniref:penicillin-binding protein 1A n=1 Tax=Luteimonas sp. MC1572 TaxID=2799325 RepID=UPI0018F0DB2B|nr:penicillin-binding protein 1A [Luteimonas sp. MC1572]MBJ6981462.1 penicillin-binding protein 1A [Luteimonas sp. MC1572]QQO02768.1 penicillin-binding protein 1A [Luteimonas sp. MC1572]
MPRFRRLLRWLLILFAGLLVIGLLAAGTLYYVVSSRLPDVQSLRNVELQEPLYVYARDGRLMALFGETRRYPVDIAEVPERLKQAFIAIEDNRFYEHHGVDYRGVSRAIWLLATTDDKRVPGGSTITQQVARQFFLSSEYSYTRKLSEMLLAMKMERELSKDEIFELYLNKSFFGNRAYGIAAAAEFYYGKKLDQLDLDELATLAAIPKFPSSGNPVTNPERARIRRDYVLQRMHELDFISEAEARAAQAVDMHATPHERPVEVYAPYVAEMVRQEMIARYGGDVLTRGYHVTTTIDPKMQLAADVAVRSGLSVYDHRHGWLKIEQTFELAADEDAATAGARLRGIPAQSGLLPAIVLRAGDGTADVALADGTTVALDAASSRWTGRNPGALLKRGDVTRVRRIEPKGKDGAAADPAAKPTWQLDQVPRAQSTLVSLEPDNGALRALVGGFSFAGQKFNRATQARRQPGSSFKPFIYAAAFERGFNPASVVVDAPVVFRMRRGQDWRPQNDDGKFAGPMRLREALVRSRNLVSVRLLDAIGVDYARRYISHMGFDESELPPNLSIALGTPSLTPLDITRGYAVFVNGGFRVTPWFIDEVKDREGKVIFKENPAVACRTCGADGTTVATSNVVDGFNLGPSQPAATAAPAAAAPEAEPAPSAGGPDRVVAPRAIDARVAYQLVSMMRDVVQRGTGTAAKVLGREDVGGKTGSTNDHRDAWFSGFGGNLATVVWVGRDDNRSLGYREYGGKSALPIWIDFMRVALDGMPIAANEPPDGMVKVAVSASGRLLPTSSDGGLVEWVKAEDLERMESTFEDVDEEVPTEEAFDIF